MRASSPTPAESSPSARRSPRDLKVLVVCTGNVCRSPIVEWTLADRRLGGGGRFRVSSAGRAAIDGAAIDREAERAARDAGLAPRPHRARLLRADLVESAELVLALDRDARASAVRLVPRASAYAFTLVEFRRLVTDVAASGRRVDLDDLVGVVAARRGLLVPPPEAGYDDISDPYGGPPRLYATVVSRMLSEVDQVVEALSTIAGKGAGEP